jgi:hypothetical protein
MRIGDQTLLEAGIMGTTIKAKACYRNDGILLYTVYNTPIQDRPYSLEQIRYHLEHTCGVYEHEVTEFMKALEADRSVDRQLHRPISSFSAI